MYPYNSIPSSCQSQCNKTAETPQNPPVSSIKNLPNPKDSDERTLTITNWRLVEFCSSNYEKSSWMNKMTLGTGEWHTWLRNWYNIRKTKFVYFFAHLITTFEAFLKGTLVRQPTVSVREARERNENKKNSIFILFCSHLIVPLSDRITN